MATIPSIILIPDTNFDKDFNINKQACERAHDWHDKHHVPLVIPDMSYQEVRETYKKFNQWPLYFRYRSDEACMRFFGMTNDALFNKIKSHFDHQGGKHHSLKDLYIESASNDVFQVGKARLLTEVVNTIQDGSVGPIDEIYLKRLAESFLPEKVDYYKELPYDIPFFTPYELEEITEGLRDEFRVRVPEPANAPSKPKEYVNPELEDFPLKDWQLSYDAVYNGQKDDNYFALGTRRMKLLKKFGMQQEQNTLTEQGKEAMMLLGWNPILVYNEENQVKAYKRIKHQLEEETKNIDMVDLTSFIESSKNLIKKEEEKKEIVFIVFKRTPGNVINTGIAKATNSFWAHSAISFDPKLHDMYTFDFFHGGFTKESIKNYPAKTIIEVIACKITTNAKEKMMNTIHNFKKLKEKTSYSLRNLWACLTKQAHENSLSMVCSNFVDYMLKVGEISPSKLSYSVMHPGRLRRSIASDRKKRFYRIFKGPKEEYKSDRVEAYISNMNNPLNVVESSKIENLSKECDDLFNQIVGPYIGMEVIHEGDFPVQFTKDGDLLIYKKDIDYESEYANSHRLLKQYAEAGNYDGMKYELAKLWYMNNRLQEEIYSKKGANREKAIKARAKILNDFNTYLKVVLKHDKKFNFQKYYKNTPYGDNRTRIRSSTIKHTNDFISFFLPFSNPLKGR